MDYCYIKCIMSTVYHNIRLSEETQARIRKVGVMGDSYESAIVRLLDESRQSSQKEVVTDV